MRKILTGAIALATIILGACSDKSKLANEIEGSWAGTPERLGDDQSGTMTIQEIFSFIKNTNSADGTINIQANVEVLEPEAAGDEVVSAYATSAAAVASAQGSWTLIDDDEIVISIDPATIQVTVDPRSLVESDDLLTDTPVPTLDSLSTAKMGEIKLLVTTEVTKRFSELNHLDDVKVKDNRLKFEIGRKHVVMARQEGILQEKP